METLKETLQEIEQSEIEVVEMVERNLVTIRDKEPEMFKAISLVIKHVAGTYSDKYAKGQDTIDTKKMLYHKEDGRAINIYQVCRYLQRYNTDGSAKSHLLKDLEKAVHYLLFEITRRIRLNQFDETEPKV